jgi:hypothetical protein
MCFLKSCGATASTRFSDRLDAEVSRVAQELARAALLSNLRA